MFFLPSHSHHWNKILQYQTCNTIIFVLDLLGKKKNKLDCSLLIKSNIRPSTFHRCPSQISTPTHSCLLFLTTEENQVSSISYNDQSAKTRPLINKKIKLLPLSWSSQLSPLQLQLSSLDSSPSCHIHAQGIEHSQGEGTCTVHPPLKGKTSSLLLCLFIFSTLLPTSVHPPLIKLKLLSEFLWPFYLTGVNCI